MHVYTSVPSCATQRLRSVKTNFSTALMRSRVLMVGVMSLTERGPRTRRHSWPCGVSARTNYLMPWFVLRKFRPIAATGKPAEVLFPMPIPATDLSVDR